MVPSKSKKDIGACQICGRDMVAGRSVDLHHLIPKTFKGDVTILIHRICHTKIHSLFTERELLNHYHTVERLVGHPEMEKFIKWVQGKAPEFRSSNRTSKNKGLRRG